MKLNIISYTNIKIAHSAFQLGHNQPVICKHKHSKMEDNVHKIRAHLTIFFYFFHFYSTSSSMSAFYAIYKMLPDSALFKKKSK